MLLLDSEPRDLTVSKGVNGGARARLSLSWEPFLSGLLSRTPFLDMVSKYGVFQAERVAFNVSPRAWPSRYWKVFTSVLVRSTMAVLPKTLLMTFVKLCTTALLVS